MDMNVRENLIMVLYEQVEAEIKRSEYLKAQSTLGQLGEYLKEESEHPAYGGVKRLYAAIYKYQGKYYPALNAASEALNFYKKRSDHKEILKVRELKGDIYFHFCYNAEAVTEWEEALEIASLLPDDEGKSVSKARIHHKLGEVHLLLAQYQHARSNYVKSLFYCKTLNDEELVRKCQAGLGSTYHLESRFKLALQIYYRTIKLARKAQDQMLIGRLLHSIGDIFTKLGEFERAKKIYLESLEISEANRDFLTSAATLRELGRVYLKDAPEKTPTFCEKSLDKLIENITVETKGDCERLMGKTFYLMALYHYNLKDNQRAMNSLVEAGEIFQRYNMLKEQKRAEILYREIASRQDVEKTIPTNDILWHKLGIG